MIIKRKRIKARGQALKRALDHIIDGEDNDAVALIRGNVADLLDARADAIRFGREYAVRHWSLSPEKLITDNQVAELVDRLSSEFGFEPERAVLWRHTKGRASGGCDEHYHLCAPEVDPVTGGVMSSSHDFARHEKISRTVELAWGHATVPCPHMDAVVAALDREAPLSAATLRGIVPIDHSASFNEADHQRLKRAGFDLPRIREMISGALSAATDRTDFDARLSAIGLRLRTGDKNDTLIIETAENGTLVGSLARLTRLRKSALAERMAFNAAGQSTDQANDPPSHILTPQAVVGTDGAGLEAGGEQRRSGPTAPDGYGHRTAAPDGLRDRTDSYPAGESGVAPGRAGRDHGPQEWLTLASGCVRHHGALLDLLAVARRAALPPLERTLSDLNDVIETETSAASRTASLPEPASLHAARRKVEEDAALLRGLEAEADEVLRKFTDGEPRSGWRRFFWPSHDPERQALEGRLRVLQGRVLKARGDRAASGYALKIEEKKFQVANARHQSDLSTGRDQREHRITTARDARTLIEKNPLLARWGMGALLRLAASVRNSRAESDLTDAPDDWDLVPVLDIWGIPLLPRPKAP
jgi:hypothetical protein